MIVKILLDSQGPHGRLTTMELTYPRFVHAEYMTHRVFSRNSASSRAIPIKKMLNNIREDPVIPMHWGAAERGMQAHAEIPVDAQLQAEELIRDHSVAAIELCEKLSGLGLHKQVVNRYIEPWMFITVIHSATSLENFFKLRCHEMAEPHIRDLAESMRTAYESSEPVNREWHMPLIREEDGYLSMLNKQLVSVARCARVSYLTHDGVRDPLKDLELAEMLRTNGHLSPWEHVAHVAEGRFGNFKGWKQLRWYVERGEEW